MQNNKKEQNSYQITEFKTRIYFKNLITVSLP